ncbi:phage portal protein [Dyella halodurans]|uniref:Phage portal protein n=1 Tax=Dyella halodurans TaxID=1920171 RepID=A0ABV9C084_9GAMM|nr:phage portal protein [Dyella halodurans]
MLETLRKQLPADKDLPARAARIDLLMRVLDGTIYDVLQYEFHQEQNGAGEYVRLCERRPSVRTGIIRTVVDDSVSLLFSEGHFPTVQAENERVVEALKAVTKDMQLNLIMVDAATRGSVGSICIWIRFLSKRVFATVLDTGMLTPIWKKDEPDVLERVEERRKVTGKQLTAAGYAGMDDATTYWFQRHWDASAETWFVPLPVSDAEAQPAVDEGKTVTHNLGFVPMVWIKNLPGGNDIDGQATFDDDAVNTVMEADYQLSQAGRGLKYSSEPTLLLKEPAQSEGNFVRSATNAIVVDKDGDAKLLEINGTASEAVIKYVEKLRELAIEHLHGNRSNADKLSAAQSGRALELLHQPLIWLADRLRVTYGEGGLLKLYRMIVAGSQKFPLTIDGENFGKLDTSPKLSLNWPAWFPPTAGDLQTLAQALSELIDGGVLSRQTAIKSIAAVFDIEDVAAEQLLIDAERKKLLAELPTPQTKVSVNE